QHARPEATPAPRPVPCFGRGAGRPKLGNIALSRACVDASFASRFEGDCVPSLQQLVPDVETLLALDPEELGILLLRALHGRTANPGMFAPHSFESELFSMTYAAYPRERQEEVLEAVREAFSWLDGQALIIAGGSNPRSNWMRISRRGRRLLTQVGSDDY